jgi:two-component system, response regulator YesN
MKLFKYILKAISFTNSIKMEMSIMLTVLVADDEQHIREGITTSISWEELQIYKVLQAIDGEQALEIARQYKIDILITDIRMPRMDGIELSREIRKMYPDCIIIFISAYSDKEYLISAIQLKCYNFVEKPLQIVQLKETLEEGIKAYQESEYKKLSNIMIQNNMKISIPLIKNEIAVLIANRNADKDLLIKCADNEMLNIDLNTSYITVIMKIISAPNSEISKSVDKKAGQELLQELNEAILSNGLQSISGTWDEEEYLIHLSSKYENCSNLNQKRIEQLLKEWYSHAKYKKIFFSIGTVVSGFEHIHESYAYAKAALNKCFFRGYGNIVCYIPEFTRAILADKEIIVQFTEALESGHGKSILQVLQGICSELHKYENTDIEEVKNLFYKLMLLLLNRIQIYGASNFTANANDNSMRNKIYNSHTLGEVSDYALELLEMYLAFIEKMSSNNSISTIICYIERYYNESSLDINSICRNTYLSPAYLCTYFKRETGKTINQYITEYRLKKSIEFLKDKRYMISEIAELVGYNDGNYFTRLFKKNFGISPSEYRERLGIIL